jgi:hypothetical protein
MADVTPQKAKDINKTIFQKVSELRDLLSQVSGLCTTKVDLLNRNLEAFVEIFNSVENKSEVEIAPSYKPQNNSEVGVRQVYTSEKTFCRKRSGNQLLSQGQAEFTTPKNTNIKFSPMNRNTTEAGSLIRNKLNSSVKPIDPSPLKSKMLLTKTLTAYASP